MPKKNLHAILAADFADCAVCGERPLVVLKNATTKTWAAGCQTCGTPAITSTKRAYLAVMWDSLQQKALRRLARAAELDATRRAQD
jgi:hypothetical protein